MTILRGISTIALTVTVLLSGSSPGSAHTGWTASGSFKASPGPEHATLVISAASVVGGGCNATLMEPDGATYSVAVLPSGVGGHRATLTWTSTAGPVDTMFIQSMDAQCRAQGSFETFRVSPFAFTINPAAAYLMISAAVAADVKWTLTGASH